jgi:hypothetical protein
VPAIELIARENAKRRGSDSGERVLQTLTFKNRLDYLGNDLGLFFGDQEIIAI